MIDPIVVDIDKKQLKEVYLWNDEMLEMVDTMYELAQTNSTVINYEGGLGDNINKFISNCQSITTSVEPTSWAQAKEANADALQATVDELNANISIFIDKSKTVD